MSLIDLDMKHLNGGNQEMPKTAGTVTFLRFGSKKEKGQNGK